MTLDFWATVWVGSGVMACMGFPHDCDQMSTFYCKNTAESGGTAGFVFSRLTSRGGGPSHVGP